jgi:hypothetical protein
MPPPGTVRPRSFPAGTSMPAPPLAGAALARTVRDHGAVGRAALGRPAGTARSGTSMPAPPLAGAVRDRTDQRQPRPGRTLPARTVPVPAAPAGAVRGQMGNARPAVAARRGYCPESRTAAAFARARWPHVRPACAGLAVPDLPCGSPPDRAWWDAGLPGTAGGAGLPGTARGDRRSRSGPRKSLPGASAKRPAAGGAGLPGAAARSHAHPPRPGDAGAPHRAGRPRGAATGDCWRRTGRGAPGGVAAALR